MKKFFVGFLTGAVLFASLGAVAAVSYIANPVDFKVIVNGKEFVSDPPALEVEGRTYLPLRAMGDALGVPVNWNEELRQAEVGTTSSLVAETDKYSRNNPAPLNTVQTYTYENMYSAFIDPSVDPNRKLNVRILEVIRGSEANKMVSRSNQFNKTPKDGYEYIIAKVAVSLLSVQVDVSVDASSYDFDFYSGNNEEYESASVVLDDKLSTKLYEGGNAEGYIVGMVKTDDANPKVAYGLDYNGAGGIWFKLQ